MSALKSLYYIGGFGLGGYFLMKAVERDPEALRKELAVRYGEDYQSEVQKQNAAFMNILKSVSQGEDPVIAARKLKEEQERQKLQSRQVKQELRDDQEKLKSDNT